MDPARLDTIRANRDVAHYSGSDLARVYVRDVGDLLDELERVERELADAHAARASDEDLLRRVFGALHVGRRHALLWTIVMDVFGIGSTSAQELCARLGYDPDQRVGRGYPAQRESAEDAR